MEQIIQASQMKQEEGVDILDWMKDLLEVPDAFWVIDSLMDKRVRNGLVEYYVHWEGFTHDWDTWEPQDELLRNARAMVFEYERVADPNCNIEAKHCTCKKQYRFEDGAMIQCDECGKWYHFMCLKITAKDANNLKCFFCNDCKENNPRAMLRKRFKKNASKKRKDANMPSFYSEASNSCFSGDTSMDSFP